MCRELHFLPSPTYTYRTENNITALRLFYSKDRISCLLFRLSLNIFLPGRILSTFCRSKLIQSVLGPRVRFLAHQVQALKGFVTHWNSWLMALVLTFKSKENVTPRWSWSLVFSSMTPWLFSSQLPLALFLEGTLKFVEVHQEFIRQEWQHEVRLGESNLLTTCPWSCLFACVVKNTERESLESSTAAWTRTLAITWNRTNDETIIASITWELTWTKSFVVTSL